MKTKTVTQNLWDAAKAVLRSFSVIQAKEKNLKQPNLRPSVTREKLTNKTQS